VGGVKGGELVSVLNRTFADRVALNVESHFPVTESAFEKLTDADVESIENEIATVFGKAVRVELSTWEEQNYPHFRREILRYGCTVKPSLMRDRTGMRNANPPPHIHSMMRNDTFAGDLYSGDMVVSAALRAGLQFEDGRNYLDFGCSSAPLVRNMAAAFPKGHWHGCDPVSQSIAWASQFFPEITLVKSEQKPPLPFPDKYFHGVYAVSVWSHLSECTSLQWFAEMRRVIEPGGYLIFTTHGYRSVLHYLELGHPVRDLGAILADLLFDQYAFRHVWDHPSQEYGLQVVDWGMAYFTVEWVTRKLFREYRLVDFQPGLNQTNQDVYVLVRM